MKKKKLLSVLLTLVLVVTLMPAMTFTSQAKADYSVSTMAQLKSYMESDGANCAVLQKDITGHADGDYKFWCTIKGTKWIDMNGHSISISNDNSREYSTLFHVPEGADLTVYDSTKSGKGNIHFDGYINDSGSYRDRSIFEVDGILTLTGVTVEAGRSKSFYDAAHARTVYKQIFGAAVSANKGSMVFVTASTLYGRGNNYTTIVAPSYGRNAGIKAFSGSTVYFNDGQIKAKGGANCFNIYGDATVDVLNGTFTCDKLDAIKCDGKTTNGIGRGRVGLSVDDVGNYATVASRSPASGNLRDTTSLTIAPAGNGDGTFTAKSGDQVQENGVTVNRLLASKPEAALDIFLKNSMGYYFHEVNPATLGVDYVRNYTMKLYQNGSLVKSKGPFSTSLRTFNVNQIFDGFTPVKNTTYKLVCEFDQVLNNKVHATGRSSDFYFKVVDDVALPVITSQSPSDIYYDEGNTVNIQINATGTGLEYTWQYLDGNYWKTMPDKTSSLKLENVPASWDGRAYKCAVSNSRGITYSEKMTLHLKTKKIEKIDLAIDAPIHGVPLDFTAETSTPGCKVVKVEWNVLMGDDLTPGATPLSGQTLYANIYVQENGAQFADNAAAYVGTTKHSTKSYPASNQLRFGFSYTVKPSPSGDAAIDTVWMQVPEPAVGSKPGYLTIINDGPYSDAFARDVRCDYGSTEWYCDGQKMSTSDTFQAGKVYKAQCTLTPRKGWAFTGGSRAEVNGELMDSKASGTNLVVSKTYVMDEESDPSGKTNPFVDVYESDEYYDAVMWAYYSDPQITNGMDATHFGPKLTVTRGQCVAFLWRSMGCPEPSSSYNPFVDVPEWQYYYKPVLWAVEKGITKGTTATTFDPDATLSTQHIVTFLYRTKNPGMDGWDGDAAQWACQPYAGRPFGVDIEVNNWTPCPRCDVVLFLYRSAAKG